jgi:putative methyltransferase (TIGR04325 family)
VAAATRAVVAGRAAYERDSVLFSQMEYNYPLLAAFMRCAALNGGQLEVVDFGGSLGSLYWQYRNLLAGLPFVRWQVVEQPAFVSVGRNEFSDGTLSFVAGLSEVVAPRVPPLLLAGSVLQYMEHPDAMLRAFLEFNARTLVLDRIPLSADPQHRLCLQVVPPYIYAASYPCWILSYDRIRDLLQASHRVIEYESAEGSVVTDDLQPFRFAGFICERMT